MLRATRTLLAAALCALAWRLAPGAAGNADRVWRHAGHPAGADRAARAGGAGIAGTDGNRATNPDVATQPHSDSEPTTNINTVANSDTGSATQRDRQLS
ncbi:MAG: hypothetical protein ACTHMR_11065, partial [Thermomicrobiales bacterium]